MNGIESDLAGQADVIRLNLLTKLGQALASRFEVRGAPATLVVSPGGDVTSRHEGLPNRIAVVQATRATLPS